jgi:hypothetical protein
MHKTHDRMIEQHFRAYIAHNFTYVFAHIRLVTVDLTFPAGGFLFLKRTVLQAFKGILKKFTAFSAEVLSGPVVVAAININHCLDSSSFAPYAFVGKHNIALVLS